MINRCTLIVVLLLHHYQGFTQLWLPKSHCQMTARFSVLFVD